MASVVYKYLDLLDSQRESSFAALEVLKSETRNLHMKIRKFYNDKDEDLLGNLYLYDPLFGWCNLIVTLRIGIYHDQLHYDDVRRQAEQFKK